MGVPVLGGAATVTNKGRGVFEVHIADGVNDPKVGAVGRTAIEEGTKAVLELAMELFVMAEMSEPERIGNTVCAIRTAFEERCEELTPIVIELPPEFTFSALDGILWGLEHRDSSIKHDREMADKQLDIAAQFIATIANMEPDKEDEAGTP